MVLSSGFCRRTTPYVRFRIIPILTYDNNDIVCLNVRHRRRTISYVPYVRDRMLMSFVEYLRCRECTIGRYHTSYERHRILMFDHCMRRRRFWPAPCMFVASYRRMRYRMPCSFYYIWGGGLFKYHALSCWDSILHSNSFIALFGTQIRHRLQLMHWQR
jgi:hypothetical protein